MYHASDCRCLRCSSASCVFQPRRPTGTFFFLFETLVRNYYRWLRPPFSFHETASTCDPGFAVDPVPCAFPPNWAQCDVFSSCAYQDIEEVARAELETKRESEEADLKVQQ